jgi:HD-like signal output (HDOD) protein
MIVAHPPTRETLVRLSQSLPAAPRILARLGFLLTDMNSATDEIVELLKRDAALTARILRVSNSVAFGAENPIASLDEALLRIGFTEVYRIAGFATAAQMVGQHLPLYEVSAAQFRENALLTALIMENLAERAGLDPCDAYTIGLLRSVGKIALDRLVKEAAAGSYHVGITTGLAEWEIGHVGISNVDAAAIILETWNFPLVALQAIRTHYRPESGETAGYLLHLAAGAAERCGHGWAGEWSYWQRSEEVFAGAGVSPEDLESATHLALEEFGPVRAAVA